MNHIYGNMFRFVFLIRILKPQAKHIKYAPHLELKIL